MAEFKLLHVQNKWIHEAIFFIASFTFELSSSRV